MKSKYGMFNIDWKLEEKKDEYYRELEKAMFGYSMDWGMPEDWAETLCVHKWIGSGVPGGSVWCSECNVDYDEKLHGSSGL